MYSLGLLTELNAERQKEAEFFARENSQLMKNFSSQVTEIEQKLYNECLSGKHNCSVNANCISTNPSFRVSDAF